MFAKQETEMTIIKMGQNKECQLLTQAIGKAGFHGGLRGFARSKVRLGG